MPGPAAGGWCPLRPHRGARYHAAMVLPVPLACLLIAVLLVVRRVWVGHPAPAVPGRTLARRELAFLSAAADTVFPPGGAIAVSGSGADVPERTDIWLAEIKPSLRVLIRLLIFLVEHATLLFPARGRGGFRRFSSLAPEQREAVLRGWAGSSLPPRRLVFQSLRAVLTMTYLADPSVLRELGLAPRDIEPGYCEADLLFPPIGFGPDAIRIEPADLRDVEAPARLACDSPLDPRYRVPGS